jgi:L-fuconate dehydratase
VSCLLLYDVQHPDPDYSCAYVVLFTDKDTKGHGLSFTIGRGTEIVVLAIKSLAHIVVGLDVDYVEQNMAEISRKLTNDTQLRWVCLIVSVRLD